MKLKMKKIISLFCLPCLLFTSFMACGRKEVEEINLVGNDSGLFYKVSKDNKVIYIGGSIHALKPDEQIGFSEAVEQAYKESNVIGCESLGYDKSSQDYYLSSIMYSHNDSFYNHINENTKLKIDELLSENHITKGEVENMNLLGAQAYISSIQGRTLGYTNSLDNLYINRARKDNKKVIAIEDNKTHFENLDICTDEEMESYIYKNLFNLDEQKKSIESLTNIILKGNLGELENYRKEFKSTSNDKYYKSMLTNRTLYQKNKIDEYINSNEKHFILVGALHLVGDEGLISLLEKDGYKVEKI